MEALKKKIIVICGSTSENSANLYIINALAKLAQHSLQLSVYPNLTLLPYFNRDVKDTMISKDVTDFRNAVAEADGVLICTPEYVFSLPGILKNAIEWTVSTTIFLDKPTALITAASSGEKAHESLILIMKTLGIKTGNDLCLLISGVNSKLSAKGEITDPELLAKLNLLIVCFNKLLN